VLLLSNLSIGCHKDVDRPAFDGERAFGWLERQVALGPRNPGSDGWRVFQEILQAHFDSLNLDYRKQPFHYFDYIKLETLSLVNWIVKINPDESERIMIGSHYDCRPRAEYDPDSTLRDQPIPGANDGASSTAVLMHLAEIISVQPPRIGVDLIFFDGEDYGPPGRIDQYLLGSSYFARHNNQDYRYALIVDMIGDRDLKIYRDIFSEQHAKAVNDKVWQVAASIGANEFVDSVKYEVIDDHLSLIAAGIPAADIIDFDYEYWHTQADTPDKCSPVSLSVVGRVLVEVIYAE
jgi:Zn-dependent M28 family amino/carboxypeptidase